MLPGAEAGGELLRSRRIYCLVGRRIRPRPANLTLGAILMCCYRSSSCGCGCGCGGSSGGCGCGCGCGGSSGGNNGVTTLPSFPDWGIDPDFSVTPDSGALSRFPVYVSIPAFARGSANLRAVANYSSSGCPFSNLG